MTVTYKGVDIPTTGDEWELYTCAMSCSKAAKSLTGALKKSLRLIDKYMTNRPVVHAVADAYYAEGGIYEKMCELSDFGASDTEPRAVASSCMNRYASIRIYGADSSERFYGI